MSDRIELTLGMERTPLTAALFEGDVKPEGIQLTVNREFGGGLQNTGERHREILEGKLPGGEFSTSSFLLAKYRGVPLRALPVFLARAFHYGHIFCHDEAPIQTPQDLAGKKVTVHRFNSTTPVWTKGLLQNEYGVPLESIQWFVAESDLKGEEPPATVQLQRIPEPATREKAVEMLASGALDAALEPYVRPGPGIRRVVENYREESDAYFHRTGILPITHTVVLREQLLDEHPWVGPSLLEAFRESRRRAPMYAKPAQMDEYVWLEGVVGEDPYAFRLGECERRAFAELSRYQMQQGLRKTPVDVDSLFALTGTGSTAHELA